MSAELHVVFRVGEAEYVLPASQVLRMEAFEGATPVPRARPHLLGVAQVRGRFVPVIDLRARFGLEAAPPGGEQRLVVGAHGDRHVALLVDRAREVLRLPPEAFAPPPPIVAAQSGGLVVAVARAGERVLLAVDFQRLVAEEEGA